MLEEDPALQKAKNLLVLQTASNTLVTNVVFLQKDEADDTPSSTKAVF